MSGTSNGGGEDCNIGRVSFVDSRGSGWVTQEWRISNQEPRMTSSLSKFKEDGSLDGSCHTEDPEPDFYGDRAFLSDLSSSQAKASALLEDT